MNELDKQLLDAATKDDSYLVKDLIKQGADVNAKYVASETALIVASRRGKTNIVETLLIDYQIEVSDKDVAILKKHNCTFTLDLLAKRDFQQSLQQDIKPIEDKKTKTNTGKL